MLNVIPLNDLREHEEQSTCDCCPSVHFKNGEMIIVHNSFDRREEIEEGGMQDCGEHPTLNILKMTTEQEKLAAANRIMNTSPIIGNSKLVSIQSILPKHYTVNHSITNLKNSIHCK